MNRLLVRLHVCVIVMSFCSLLDVQKCVYAQGCSDAGFCTLHPLRPTNQVDSSINQVKNQVAMGLGFGEGHYGIYVTTPYVEYSRSLNQRWLLNAKLGYLFANGDVKNNGFSDVYLNASYSFGKTLKGTLGLKIPLSNGNQMQDDKSLPMNYQTSLGTLDLVWGLSVYPIKHLGITVAMQQPLTQNNNQYPTTNKFHRQGDVLVRGTYQIVVVKSKLEATFGLLPIYHLKEDTYLNEAGNRVSIEGSEGLTLNGNLFLLYHLDERQSFELSGGKPFITRKAQPDGLARNYVLGLEYKFSF